MYGYIGLVFGRIGIRQKRIECFRSSLKGKEGRHSTTARREMARMDLSRVILLSLRGQTNSGARQTSDGAFDSERIYRLHFITVLCLLIRTVA